MVTGSPISVGFNSVEQDHIMLVDERCVYYWDQWTQGSKVSSPFTGDIFYANDINLVVEVFTKKLMLFLQASSLIHPSPESKCRAIQLHGLGAATNK